MTSFLFKVCIFIHYLLRYLREGEYDGTKTKTT